MKSLLFSQWLIKIKVGFFLAAKEIKHTNSLTTGLLIFVMTLTFLNLLVVNGVLLGFVEGASNLNRKYYSADILVTNLPEKPYIEESTKIQELIKSFYGVESLSARYIAPAQLETQSVETNENAPTEIFNTIIVGIDPEKENNVSQLSETIVEGSYLQPDDTSQILVGANVLKKYSPIDSPAHKPLKNAGVGSQLLLYTNGRTKEVTVKGVVKSKVAELDQRIYASDQELQTMLTRSDFNVNEIAIKIKKNSSPETVIEALSDFGVDRITVISTWQNAEPKLLNDIRQIFTVLGNIIGTTSLIAAAITNFIVIFINAIARRSSIGILKSIGIKEASIEIAYVIQSVFYAFTGIILSIVIVYGILKPYLETHPIDFPMSNGVLFVSATDTVTRALLLLLVSLIAGYIPAKIVSSQNIISAMRSN